MATGYGLATMTWLVKNHKLKPNWDSCGTIMDFLSIYFEGDKFLSKFISNQNAYSWGYSNGLEWQLNVINFKFKK